MMDETIDWNDPEARLALIERVGTEEYNRLVRVYQEANPIQVVPSRYGVVYWVTDAQVGFSTREEAEACLARGGKEERDCKAVTDRKSKRGFYHFAGSWYAKHLKPQEDVIDEV